MVAAELCCNTNLLQTYFIYQVDVLQDVANLLSTMFIIPSINRM